MKDMRELVGDLSQTNHYMVSFSTLNSTLMSYIQKRIGFQEDVRNFLSRKTGLLCSDASLPTSSLATGEVRDDFMGIPQEFAHTRLYTDIDFTFYVDSNYVNLKIFESWMDYIAGGSEADLISELDDNYYRRMNYPDNYKVQTMFISKFERDFNSQIDYQFVNAFPKLVTAIPVSYGAADLLKVSVQFTYDRYIVNPRGSIRKSNTSGFNDIARVSNDSTINDNKQYFYDLNMKFNTWIGDQDRLFISSYLGRDAFKFGSLFASSWGNETINLRWLHLFSDQVVSNLSYNFNDYDYLISILPEGFEFDWISKIRNHQFKYDVSYFHSNQHQFKTGLSVNKYHFEPGIIKSPSFSLFLSSTNKNIFPFLASFIISLIEDNNFLVILFFNFY